MKTLKNFLEKHNVCRDGFDFAKDLTLEQFLNTCKRGDWILWLFKRTNPKSFRQITLAKAHCANTVRHLMQDERSINAVDVAIAFGENRASENELKAAAAYSAAAADAYSANTAANSAYSAYSAAAAADVDSDSAAAGSAFASYASADAFAAYGAAGAARKQNQKLTADICRKYLPLEIWDQSEI